MKIDALRNITSIGQFTRRASGESIGMPERMSQRQAEWEFYVSKLHGRDLTATDEDLETVKKLVNRLGG